MKHYNWYHRNTKDYKEYYEQLYTKKLDNLEKNGQISWNIKLTKTESWSTKSEQTNNVEGDWISNQKSPKKEKSKTRWFHWWILWNIFFKTEAEFFSKSLKKLKRTLPNSFYKVSITRITKPTKPDKDITRRLQAHIPDDEWIEMQKFPKY